VPQKFFCLEVLTGKRTNFASYFQVSKYTGRIFVEVQQGDWFLIKVFTFSLTLAPIVIERISLSKFSIVLGAASSRVS